MRVPPQKGRVFAAADSGTRYGLSLVVFAVGLLVLLFLFGLVAAWVRHVDRQLEQTIAELDRKDPGWRLQQIEAKREKLADKENGAKVVLAAYELLPKDREKNLDVSILDEVWMSLPPTTQLNGKQIAVLRTLLQRSEKALHKARELVHFKKGRYDIEWTDDVYSTPFWEHQNKCREVAGLLGNDVLLLCQEQKAIAAWQSCRCLFVAARTLAEEQHLIGQLVGAGLRSKAVLLLERIVAQGQFPSKSLAEAQKLLQEEAKLRWLETMIGGERALVHHFCQNMESGKIRFSSNDGYWLLFGGKPQLASYIPDRVIVTLAIKPSHVFLLKWYTRALEYTKLPDHEQRARFETMGAELEGMKRNVFKRLAHDWAGALLKLADASSRGNTYLHCAIVAMALERYRLKHKRWPNNLNTLVKEGLLQKVPIDCYSGKPLKYRQSKNGVVVYSVGMYGDYKGQSLDDPNTEAVLGAPPEFRLWNVSLRRQSPK